MPSIADQVATVEHDLAAALASIDTLNAANAALTSANVSLQSENAALQAQCNDMKHQVDDVRTMADTLARNALDMLRASRQQIGLTAAAPAVALAPKSDGDKLLAVAAAAPQPDADVRKVDTVKDAVAAAGDPIGALALQAVTASLAAQGDSGDEHTVVSLRPGMPIVENGALVGYNNFDSEMQKALEADGLKLQQLTGQDHGPVFLDDQHTGYAISSQPGDPGHNALAPETVDAMSRIHGGATADGPMIVAHDDNDLPMFLRAPRTIFG